jgi:hypothetical protein
MKRRHFIVGLLIFLFINLVSTQQAPLHIKDDLAEPADDFVRSIGVNTHYYYLNHTFPDGSSILSKLEELGIRQVREGIDLGFFSKPQNEALLNAAGIRFSFITDFHAHSAEQVRDWFKKLGPEKVASVENRNEPDVFDRQADGSWPVQEVREYQVDLWNTIKKDDATKHIEVIGPSLTSSEAAVQLGDSVAAYMDHANIHNYLSSREPETQGWGDDGYGSLEYAIRRSALPIKPDSRAPLSTETCYQNSTNESGLPEKIAGRYVPRHYLFSFAKGIPRTYCYEFWDEGPTPNKGEENFGFVRHDGSPKPVYKAVQAMITLLSDPGESFAPETLSYSLAGQTDDVQRVLLQKRNGDFYLALWLGKASWNPATQVEMSVSNQAVTVQLPDTITEVTGYSLSDQGEMIHLPLTLKNGQVDIELTDRVFFLKLAD